MSRNITPLDDNSLVNFIVVWKELAEATKSYTFVSGKVHTVKMSSMKFVHSSDHSSDKNCCSSNISKTGFGLVMTCPSSVALMMLLICARG